MIYNTHKYFVAGIWDRYPFLLIYFVFGYAGSSLLCAAFSNCGKWGATLYSWFAGFSLWELLLLWSTGSSHADVSSCSSWVLEHSLSSCGAWA